MACTGNSPARDRVVGIRAKADKDPAVLRIKPPRQIANWDTAPRKLAKRVNRPTPQRHLVGTRLLKRERERFRVVVKRPARSRSRWSTGRLRWLSNKGRPAHQSMKADTPSPRTRAAHAKLRSRSALASVKRAESCAFKNEGGEGNSSGHPRRIRCHIPLTAPSHVQAARSATWSEGCGASERNAVELAAIPQVVRSKARCLKRHTPAHRVPNQNGAPHRRPRNDPTKSKERLRLKAQVECLATRNIANRRASALPMPRKLESKALHARARKRQGNFIPGGSLLREAVQRAQSGPIRAPHFPRIRRRSTPRLHAKAHALEIEAARLPPNLARHFAALLQNLACHLRRPSFAPMRCIRSNAPRVS